MSIGIVLVWDVLAIECGLLTALLAVVVVAEVFLKIGDIYDFAFFEVCVVHGRCKSFGV